MAQVGIREFDAKRMFFESIWKKYKWILIDDIKDVKKLDKDKSYVLKPDMLFGWRWKLGLVGVGLDKKESEKWLEKKLGKKQEVSWVDGTLDVFLAEEFTPHTKEYYISFQAGRDADTVHFSEAGWVEVESNWDSVTSIDIPTMEDLKESDLKESFWIAHKDIIEVIMDLWKYYKDYGFVYLEVNPFCFHQETGDIVLLDMVAKLDDQEHFKQQNHWKDLVFPPTLGFKEEPSERHIRELDEKTGASMKHKILNPEWSIWTIIAWGWASLVFTDTIGALWYADELWNYWELAGGPDFENTYEYTKTFFSQMFKSPNAKYFIIGWVIANFTNIATTFGWFVAAIKDFQDEFRDRDIKILVRRWWIQEEIWLPLLKSECEKMGINCTVAWSSDYMTNILKEIKL